MDTVKNMAIFLFWCIMICGIAVGFWMKGCWDNTSHWSEQQIHEFYRDGGTHDQIVQQEEQERQEQLRLREQYRQQDNHAERHARQYHHQDENQD